MPLYTFRAANGDSVEELVSAGTSSIKVGDMTYLRVTEPQPFAMSGVSGGIPSQGEQVKHGYYKLECEKGTRFDSQFSKKKIKQAWGF